MSVISVKKNLEKFREIPEGPLKETVRGVMITLLVVSILVTLVGIIMFLRSNQTITWEHLTVLPVYVTTNWMVATFITTIACIALVILLRKKRERIEDIVEREPTSINEPHNESQFRDFNQVMTVGYFQEDLKESLPKIAHLPEYQPFEQVGKLPEQFKILKKIGIQLVNIQLVTLDDTIRKKAGELLKRFLPDPTQIGNLLTVHLEGFDLDFLQFAQMIYIEEHASFILALELLFLSPQEFLNTPMKTFDPFSASIKWSLCMVYIIGFIQQKGVIVAKEYKEVKTEEWTVGKQLAARSEQEALEFKFGLFWVHDEYISRNSEEITQKFTKVEIEKLFLARNLTNKLIDWNQQRSKCLFKDPKLA